MFESENGDKEERRERWERRKGWKTFHFGLNNIPPNQNIGSVVDGYFDERGAVVDAEEREK